MNLSDLQFHHLGAPILTVHFLNVLNNSDSNFHSDQKGRIIPIKS